MPDFWAHKPLHNILQPETKNASTYQQILDEKQTQDETRNQKQNEACAYNQPTYRRLRV